ncbi:MAG TPA: beta-L-arabinofuranosidase domain-containing protein [Acidobacteriaceae bacterium]|jgi:hypothetical protein|nr:beta-L-arabinofuranosidase domain-containing protein [Acidobacteriaceae bacterium]
MIVNTKRDSDVSRREFLRLAAMTSALTLAPAAAFGASDAGDVPWHGALAPLAPGAVRPDGWLRGWLQKQANQLGSHLPEVSWPFTKDYWGEEQRGAFWTPEQEGEQWWPWEQKAYWIDGATRLAILLGDQQLLEKTKRPIAYTFLHPDRQGYLGPELFQDPLGDYHRWPHVVFFRSVAAMVDASVPVPGLASAQIAGLMQRHYLTDDASYGKPKRNVNNIEDMLWCYSRTRDPRLMSLAESAWAEYQKYADDPENADLGALRVLGDTPINAHGETYAETSKQPAILYLYTGNPQYLRFGLAAQRRIFDFHMLIDGVPSTSEWFSTLSSLDSHETCGIADHTWSWGYCLMATGDAAWADRIERACFNAAPGALRNDWKALQYLSCPNQFLATLDSDHNWPKFPEHGMGMMAYQPNPGKRTACCAGNVHRILPNYVIRMWMKKGDGLAAVLYGPSTVNAVVGAANTPVEIAQTTHYPFDDEIRLRVNADAPVTFPLSLRIPGWCEAPRVTVNEAPVHAIRGSDGFIVLRRTFRPGDRITLTLPMKPAISHWPQNGIGLERGPLVYSLPIETAWTTKVEPMYSTPEFPAWEARPKSAWNYGLALDEATLEHAVQVQTQPATAEEALDPWENPPVHMKVPARKIAGWELQANPEKPEQKFTPPLPDLSAMHVSELIEPITLVPYGATKLRVTLFPAVKS